MVCSSICFYRPESWSQGAACYIPDTFWVRVLPSSSDCIQTCNSLALVSKWQRFQVYVTILSSKLGSNTWIFLLIILNILLQNHLNIDAFCNYALKLNNSTHSSINYFHEIVIKLNMDCQINHKILGCLYVLFHIIILKKVP